MVIRERHQGQQWGCPFRGTRDMEKSKGHIGFDGFLEYFRAGSNIYTACTVDPVMPDGYRCGRFYCSALTFMGMPTRVSMASEMSMGIGAHSPSEEKW